MKTNCSRWLVLCLGFVSLFTVRSTAFAKSNYFWFGPHQFLTCEALLSQAQLSSDFKGVTRAAILKAKLKTGPMEDKDAPSYNRVTALTLKKARSSADSRARLNQLYKDIEDNSDSGIQVFGFQIRGQDAIRDFAQKVQVETGRLELSISEGLKRSFPFPLKGYRPSLVLGMFHSVAQAALVVATPFVAPTLMPFWLMLNLVTIDQLAERVLPVLGRTDNNSIAALGALAEAQSDAFFHLGRDFQILADMTERWELLLESGQSIPDMNRLAALEDNIVGREFFHEMWRLFQLYGKDATAFAAYLKENEQKISDLAQTYRDFAYRPTQMGFARYLASEESGLNRKTYTDLFGFVENGEPVLVYVVRAFRESPASPTRRPIKEWLLERLMKYAEMLKALKDQVPAYGKIVAE